MRPIGEVGASQFLPLIAMSLRVLATLLLGVAFLLGGALAEISRGSRPSPLPGVSLTRLDKGPKILGQNNTFKTLLTNETEHTLRLKLYQGFVLYFVDASNRGVETKEIRLEAIETTREVAPGGSFEFDYQARLPRGAVLPGGNYRFEISVIFHGPEREEGGSDEYSASWRDATLELKERHSLLDLEMIGVLGMTVVAGGIVAYVTAQTMPASRVGVLVNGLIDSIGKPRKSAPKPRAPPAEGEVDEWLQGTAADTRAKSAPRSKSQGKGRGEEGEGSKSKKDE